MTVLRGSGITSHALLATALINSLAEVLPVVSVNAGPTGPAGTLTATSAVFDYNLDPKFSTQPYRIGVRSVGTTNVEVVVGSPQKVVSAASMTGHITQMGPSSIVTSTNPASYIIVLTPRGFVISTYVPGVLTAGPGIVCAQRPVDPLTGDVFFGEEEVVLGAFCTALASEQQMRYGVVREINSADIQTAHSLKGWVPDTTSSALKMTDNSFFVTHPEYLRTTNRIYEHQLDLLLIGPAPAFTIGEQVPISRYGQSRVYQAVNRASVITSWVPLILIEGGGS